MTARVHGRYIEIYQLPGTTNQKDSEQMSPHLTSDLGVEENPEMSLNTFSGYDGEIADLAQIGAAAERAHTTTRLTSRSPGPAKPRDARCQESRMPERFEAAVRGGTDNFTDVIADKAKPSRCCAMVLGSLEDLGKAAKVSRSESSQQQTSAVSKQQQ